MDSRIDLIRHGHRHVIVLMIDDSRFWWFFPFLLSHVALMWTMWLLDRSHWLARRVFPPTERPVVSWRTSVGCCHAIATIAIQRFQQKGLVDIRFVRLVSFVVDIADRHDNQSRDCGNRESSHRVQGSLGDWRPTIVKASSPVRFSKPLLLVRPLPLSYTTTRYFDAIF